MRAKMSGVVLLHAVECMIATRVSDLGGIVCDRRGLL